MVAVGPDDEAERSAWLAALAEAIDERSFCLGPAVDRFESRCREILTVPHAIGMNSGTDAIRLGLQAVGVGPGDEVIAPAFSFFSTASSIAHLGAIPRFVDVDRNSGLIDIAAAIDLFGPKTKAIIPVHLYGQGAPLEELIPAAKSAGVAVVEDAAQSFGVRYRGEALGTIGDAGAFSFYPTKNLGAAGDAGLAVTRSDQVAERLRSLRVHGDAGGYQHLNLGWNARMDGFQGAVLSVKLDRLEQIQSARTRNVESYHQALEANGLLDRLRPLARTPGSEHGWHQFIVRTDRREKVREALNAAQIGCGLYYPGILPTQPAFGEYSHDPVSAREAFPGASELADTALALPVHHRLQPEDPARVVEVLAKALSD